MSKRKREITSNEGQSEGETDMPVVSQRERSPRPTAGSFPAGGGAAVASAPGGIPRLSDLKENILLVVLILYVLLLALGTAGELFEVDWILELPLFK